MPAESCKVALQRLFGVLAMLKGKSNSLDEDEETVRPRDNSIEKWFFWPRCSEVPFRGHEVELASGEGL